jgi:hypothetical protein
LRRITSGALVLQLPRRNGPVPIAASPLLNSALPFICTDFGTMKICARFTGSMGSGPLVRTRKVRSSTGSTAVTPNR